MAEFENAEGGESVKGHLQKFDGRPQTADGW